MSDTPIVAPVADAKPMTTRALEFIVQYKWYLLILLAILIFIMYKKGCCKKKLSEAFHAASPSPSLENFMLI